MSRRELVVVGAVACVACCAGPILGVLGGIGALGRLSTQFIGVAGIFIVAAAALAFEAIRRQRARADVSETEAVPVDLSRRP